MKSKHTCGLATLLSVALPLGLSFGNAACSSDASSSSGAGGAGSSAGASAAAGTSTGGGSTSDAIVGGFIVELKPKTGSSDAYTSISGEVFDGPTPSTLVWSSVAKSGECELSKPSAPFCDPGCGGSAVCVADNQCQAYPTAKDLGPVSVMFGVDPAITIKAIANIYGAEVDTPYPAAAEGVPVVLTNNDGPFGSFHLTIPMVAPLETATTTLQLESAKALPLSWTAAGPQAYATLRVKVDISHHGGIKGKIECEGDDDGALEIPADLVTQLIALGVAGFPTVTLTRATSSNVKIAPGVVSFEALSSVVIPLTVAGFTSCADDSECPAGKTCQQSKVCTK
jgi:hypothetical protein